MHKLINQLVSKGGAVIYFRKEVSDIARVNNIWKDHFNVDVTKKIRLSSNKLVATIPLSASEMSIVFSSPELQVGGEKVFTQLSRTHSFRFQYLDIHLID